MKTLANPKDKAQIVGRLQLIDPTCPPRWGKMSAHQMICHLSDVFRSSMGERKASRAADWIPRLPLRCLALWLPFPWPPGFPARPEWDQRLGGTGPSEFEADLAELHRLLERFTQQPSTFEWCEHAIFGHLSDAEWQRLGYRHMDHHLRQFGA
jgi:hypothetical protein